MALAVSVAALGACQPNEPAYFPAEMVLSSAGDSVPVQQTLALRYRVPTASERAETDARSTALGYAVPWLRQDRLHLELKYTITNLGAVAATFSLFVDGANEFTRFDYQAVAAAFDAENDDPPPLGLMTVVNAPILAPGQVYQGVIREDDFREAALDLDALGRFMAPFVAVLINRSEVNPVGLDMVPTRAAPPRDWILPAFWELTARFQTKQPMSLQFLVRVRDDDQRLWKDGDGEFVPTPTTFTPVIP